MDPEKLDELATKFLQLAKNNDVYSVCALDGIRLACQSMPGTLMSDTNTHIKVSHSDHDEFRSQWQQMLQENWCNIETAC